MYKKKNPGVYDVCPACLLHNSENAPQRLPAWLINALLVGLFHTSETKIFMSLSDGGSIMVNNEDYIVYQPDEGITVYSQGEFLNTFDYVEDAA